MDTNDEKNQSMDAAATPESTSFIPPSLASFMAKAQATLDDVQHNLHFDSPEANNNASVSMDQDTSVSSIIMREDEDDKKLKQEVLDKLNEKNKVETSMDDKEESILETANLLLDLDACDEEIIVSSEQPSPIKTADSLLPVSQEGEEFSDLPSRDNSVASPEKSHVSTSSVASEVANNDAETKRDSGSSRASGWKNLISSIPTKDEVSPIKPVNRDVEPNLPSPISAAESPAKSQHSPAVGKDTTPMSIMEKPTEPSTAGSVSLPKDTIMSPPIPTAIDPMAMSAALEVTSPLPVNISPNLSASTPALAAPSPWKNAFQSMAARLEDRVTPPTPEQQSPVLTKQSPPKDLTSDPLPTNVKPSPTVPSRSPALSRQSLSPREEDATAVSSPVASLPKVSPQAKSGLILSPSDSLPAHSAKKSVLPASPDVSLPQASPQVARQSGLILSPSDSLPEPSPQQATRKSGLVLSPSDSLPEATLPSAEKNAVDSSLAASLAAASPQVPRQSGLVLSPSDSLPAQSPSTAGRNVQESLQSAEKVPTSPPEKNDFTVSPAASLVKGGSNSTAPSSLSKASAQSAEKRGVVSSPAASLATTSPKVARQSGLVLSPSDSLPVPSPSTAGKSQSRASPSVTSPPSAVKSQQIASPATSLPPQSIEKSPAASLPRRSPQSAAKDGLVSATPSSLSKASPHSAEKSGTSSAGAKRGQPVSPPASLPKLPSSTAKSAEIKPVSPKKPVEKESAVSPSSTAKKTSPSLDATQQVKVDSSVSTSPSVPGVPPSVSPKTEAKSTNEAVSVEQVAASVSQLSTNDDEFLPNKQSFVTDTPSARRPVHASKSEASKRVTESRTGARTASSTRKSMPATNKSIDRQRMPSSSTRTTASKKTTPVASSSKSRLFQGTASTQAHTKGVAKSTSKPAPRTSTSSSSRLSRGTAASEARAKMASPTPKPVAAKKQTSAEDGRAKARERVRQQKLAAEKSRKQASETAEKQVSRSRTRGSTLTAEEGRALARERVKRQQATATAQPHIAPMKGKENRVQPSKRVVRSTASVPSSGVRSARRPTIPKSPNFATKAVLGDKPRDRRVRGGSMKLDPNPISRASGSATHSDRNGSATTRGSMSSSSSRRLTVPKAPRLSTTAKYGDKPPPSLRATKPPKPASQAKPPPRKREYKPTQPVPFKFHSSKTCASAVPPAGKETEPSLAERVQLYSRKGLREETPSTPSMRRSYKPTIPKSPEFSSISHRAMPKSTAELEEEMMEYYNSHPFKAAPVGVDDTAETGPPKQAPKRRLTQPAPFHFHADDRAAHAKPPVGSPDPEARDLAECKKQFHARPLPRSFQNPPPRKEAAAVPRALTTPKPFSLSTDRRAAKSEPRGPTADEIELSKQFHARKAPKTTYVGPKSRSRTGVSKSTTTSTPRHYAGPPKLATSARAEPREASRMASQKNAEQLARQKEQLALRKKREKHQEDMAKASMTSPPPNTEPFHLQSEARHEAYQQHLAEQLAQEEEESKQKMLFTAKPLRLSDPPPPIRSDRPATTPRPFALRSVSRHERWRDERQKQLEAEERERQRLMNVKAMPLPDTTYKYTPVTPASQKKRNGEGGEARDLDSARKKAMEALQSAEEEMPYR